MAMNPRLLVPRATGFNPKSISGLTAWLDASNKSSLTIATGAAEWTNLAGAGSVTQTTANNQPTLSAFANGRQALSFDGTNDSMEAPIGNSLRSCVANAAGFSVYCAIRPAQVAAYADLFVARYDTGFFLVAHWPDRHNINMTHPGGRAANRRASGSQYTANTPAIAVMRSDLPGNTCLGAVDTNTVLPLGVLSGGTLANALPATLTRFRIGFEFGYFSGLFGELLVYARDVTTAENAMIVQYLMRKWGVT